MSTPSWRGSPEGVLRRLLVLSHLLTCKSPYTFSTVFSSRTIWVFDPWVRLCVTEWNLTTTSMASTYCCFASSFAADSSFSTSQRRNQVRSSTSISTMRTRLMCPWTCQMIVSPCVIPVRAYYSTGRPRSGVTGVDEDKQRSGTRTRGRRTSLLS